MMDRLRIISEAEARGELKKIYADIRHRMRFPRVPDFIQAFAPFPDFLRLCHKEVRAHAGAGALEHGAAHVLRVSSERVAAELHPEADIAYLSAPRRKRLLKQYHEQLLPFYLGAPRVLIWIALIHSWFSEHRPGETRERLVLKPLPWPEDMGIKIKTGTERKLSAPALALLEQIRQDLDMPVIHTACRALVTTAGDFLPAAWQSLRGVLRRPQYESIRQELLEVAGAWARELSRNTVTRARIESLADMNDLSMRLLSLIADTYYELSPAVVIHFTYWAQQLHAARSV